MDMKFAFVTGGTGLLGVNIVKELIQNTSAKIYLLVRNPTPEKREKFFKDLLAFSGGLWPVGFFFNRIKFVEGDVTLPHLGMTTYMRARLAREVDIIYHSAAVITLSGAESEVQAANVQGTKNVLDFALRCAKRGRLDSVIHVSTVAVSGDREGVVYEDELDEGQGFNNPYEKSKFDAEKLVHEYRDHGLNILVVRPSMVIGDSRTGFTNHFNIFYFQLRLLAQGLLDAIPLCEGATYNLIPADFAGRAIYLISIARDARNMTYHIVNPHDVEVAEFVERTCAYLGYRQPAMVQVSASNPLPSSAFSGVRGKVLGIYHPYISKRKAFNACIALGVLKKHGFAWPRVEGPLYTNMLDACVFSGYLPLKCEVRDEVRTYNA